MLSFLQVFIFTSHADKQKVICPPKIALLINLTFLGPSHFDYLVNSTYRRLFSRKITMVYEKLPYIEQSSCGNLQSSYKTVERERERERERETACFYASCLSLRLHSFTVSTKLFNHCKY